MKQSKFKKEFSVVGAKTDEGWPIMTVRVEATMNYNGGILNPTHKIVAFVGGKLFQTISDLKTEDEVLIMFENMIELAKSEALRSANNEPSNTFAAKMQRLIEREE